MMMELWHSWNLWFSNQLTTSNLLHIHDGGQVLESEATALIFSHQKCSLVLTTTTWMTGNTCVHRASLVNSESDQQIFTVIKNQNSSHVVTSIESLQPTVTQTEGRSQNTSWMLQIRPVLLDLALFLVMITNVTETQFTCWDVKQQKSSFNRSQLRD